MISSAYIINDIGFIRERVYCDVWNEFGRYVFMNFMFQRVDMNIFYATEARYKTETFNANVILLQLPLISRRDSHATRCHGSHVTQRNKND